MKIQNIIKIITVGVFVCVTGFFFCINQNQQNKNVEKELITCDITQESSDSVAENSPEKAENGSRKKKSIFVHVCGAVKKSGVYELKEGSRICDALIAAGGFKKTADQTFLNQAQVLSDGEQVVVPTKGKTVQNANKVPESQSTQKISINHATCEELMTLPGIGESKANTIIKYREENGNFQTLEDLKKIQGIKDGVYSKIIDYIML